MANTRNCNNNHNGDNNEENNQNVNPLPPPLPTLEQLLVMQAQMLQTMQQTMVNTSKVVLFDSGASHSFISTAYVEKHNLPMTLLRCQTIVSSPGGDMPAR
jgi:hypothetical protein